MATIIKCVGNVIKGMDPEMGAYLHCMITYGKDFSSHVSEVERKKNYYINNSCRISEGWVADELESCFQIGTGFKDIMRDISDNYGKQLDVTIKEVLVKSFKISKPSFSEDKDTVDGAVEREEWITEKLLNSMVTGMDEDARKEFAKKVEKLLREKE